MIIEIDLQVKNLKENQKLTMAKINSAERDNNLKDIEGQMKTLTDFKAKLEIGFQEAYDLRKQEIDLVHKYQDKKQQK